MIWLTYQDEAERTQALASLVRGSQGLGARCVFLGSEAACAATSEAVGRTEAALLPHLSFRPVRFPAGAPKSDPAWAGTVEVLRTSLLESSAMGHPVVAWIEPPLPRSGVARTNTLRACSEKLGALAQARDGVTVLCALRLDDVSARALLSIVDGRNALVSTRMIVPACPAWVLSPAGCNGGHGAGAPDGRPAPDPIFTPLFQAEKLVALGQLGAGVAHELGNPLSIISSSLQYLHQRLAASQDPASDFTMTALNNVERMRGLLGSILDFAAVKKPRSEQVDLKEAISEVLRFTSPECAQRGIAVEISFDPFLPRIWMDPGGLKQIILNLVKNALDAMTADNFGDTLHVRTHMGKNKQMAAVEVENNGAAIPADVLPNLFRPFFTTKDGGTGLGLYLSRRIAEDHGGQLAVENRPDGVCFTLTLPLDRRKR